LDHTIGGRKRTRLELANSRTEVLAISEGPESWTRGIETLERQLITAPADTDTLLLQGKEDDQGRKCNGAGKSGGSDAKGGNRSDTIMLADESDTH
jgi:hypothetical protein